MFKSRAIGYCLAFGFGIAILSIPFYAGIMRPVFDLRNPYTVIYGVIISPVNLLLRGLTVSIAEIVWDNPSVGQIDIVAVDLGVMFWALVGYVLGLMGDLRRGVRA